MSALGCDCTELCSMGPTCPGGTLAGLEGSGCWRTAVAPKRIQRRRTKGWRMPEGAIYVGRPTRWGNPYRVGARSAYWTGPAWASSRRPDPIPIMDAEHVTQIYRQMLETNQARFARGEVRTLAGHDLACWCPLDQPCHADVLLDLANRGPS